MRRWSSAGVLGLCCALSALTCAPRVAEAPLPTPRVVFRQVPIGSCEDYPEEMRSIEGARRDFEALQAMGVHTLRVSLGWDELEPARDQYEFGFWDAFVELAGAHEIELIPYVAYTPEWNASGGGPGDFWRSPPRDLDQFAELMGLLAARYRGRIRSWELWNEPDNRDYWRGSVAEYAELLRRGADAVHAVDERLAVVSGGLAGHLEFLDELFEQQDAARFVDVVNLHAYYETWNPEPLEALSGYVAAASELVQRHGGRQSLWAAEVGYSDFRDGPRVSDATSAWYVHEHTLEYQAVVLVRTLTLLLSSPSISLIAWYELKDLPAAAAVIGDANNRHLGVLFSDDRAKPARAALAWMVRSFGDGFQPLSEGLQVEPARSANSAARQLYAFLTPRRSVLVIGWLAKPAAPPVGSAPGGARDERRDALLLRLPYAARSSALRFDALGRELGPAPWRALPGATELQLELRGDDVEIVELPVRAGG
jgi:class 3 adenylate cyclase